MDNINHPSHYTFGRYECLDVMRDVFTPAEFQAYCKLNAFKYIWRANHKGHSQEDLAKAAFYLNTLNTPSVSDLTTTPQAPENTTQAPEEDEPLSHCGLDVPEPREAFLHMTVDRLIARFMAEPDLYHAFKTQETLWLADRTSAPDNYTDPQITGRI